MPSSGRNRTEYAMKTSSSGGGNKAGTDANTIGRTAAGVFTGALKGAANSLIDAVWFDTSGSFPSGPGLIFGEEPPQFDLNSPGEELGSKIGIISAFLLSRKPKSLLKPKTKLKDDTNSEASVKGKKRDNKDERDCDCEGNPTRMPKGQPVSWDASFQIPGLIPLNIQSAYRGDSHTYGPFGRNRIGDIDATLEVVDGDKIRYVDSDGFPVHFDRPTPIPEHWEEGDTTRGLKLMAGRKRSYILKEKGEFHNFYKHKDGFWRIGKIEDRNGNTVNLNRDNSGRLLSIKTPEQLTLLFDYNAEGLRTRVRLQTISGEERAVLIYQYDQFGNMTLSESPYGDRIEYEYDENHRRSKLIKNGKYIGQYTYDEKGRSLKTKTNGPYNEDRFEYDDENRISTYIPANDPSKLKKYYYNENDNTFAEVNALGFIKRKERDEHNYVSAEIDAEGNRTEYTYDHDGNIKSITDGEGRKTFFTWDEDSNLEILIDPEGNSWDRHYDEKGNLTAIEDANRFRTDIVNTDQGLTQKIMRHDGMMRQHAYDEHFRLIGIKDFNDAITYFSRDNFGRIVSVKNPLGAITAFEYHDQLGQDFWTPSKIIRPDGVISELKSKGDRGKAEVIEAGGRRTTYVHDAFGKLQETIDSTGAVLTFQFDHSENLEKVINQQGREWTFERDGAGRIVREIDFGGQVFNYAYDMADRLIKTKRSDGGRTSYKYDKSGLITEESVFSSDNDQGDIVSYEYDDRGLLAKIENSHSILEFEYDANGQVIAEISNGYRIESDYNCCGLRSERRVFAVEREEEPEDLLGISEGLRALAEMRGEGSATTIGAELQITKYLYDTLGDLKEIQIGGHQPLVFQRDALGRETSRASENGFSLTQTHDLVNQLTGQQAGRALSGLVPEDKKISPQTALERQYGWNTYSEPTKISDKRWGETSYVYDERGQIKESIFGDGFKEKFQYDAAQNISGVADRSGPVSVGEDSQGSDPVYTLRTSSRKDFGEPSRPAADKFLNWKSSKCGRVEEARGAKGERIKLKYDDRGRVMERLVERNGFRPQKWTFAWDGRDRLASTITPDGHKWTYTYDPLGRRISKTRHILADNDEPLAGKPREWREVQKVSYLWDGDVLVWVSQEDKKDPVILLPGERSKPAHHANGERGVEPGSTYTARKPIDQFTRPEDDPEFEARQKTPDKFEKQTSLAYRVEWYFEPDSFVPLARKQGDRLEFAVVDHLGTPRELMSEDGEVTWSAEYTTWGQLRRIWQADNDNIGPHGPLQGYDLDGNPVYITKWYGSDGNAALKPADNPDPYHCPIRFQGQWADQETGLYYNRFRYYDSLSAQYISPDPIGLEGGFRSHGYVEYPTGWIDPFGLAGSKKGPCGGKGNKPKPYANPKNRPKYAKGQVEQVWQDAVEKGGGTAFDPNTGAPLSWDKTKSRNNQWDMGHKTGHEYRNLHKDYMAGKITKEDFLKQYRDPNNYQAEDPSSNRGHEFEKKDDC